MKKYISLFAALCICLSFMTSCSATETIQAEENIETTIILQINNPIMTVNGQDMEIDPGRGTVPLIQNDRTLVPVCAIVEAMGGSVNWDEETQTAFLELNGDIITMTLGSQTAYFNETANTLDVVPVSINGRTMLPIRFIAERFNFDVN